MSVPTSEMITRATVSLTPGIVVSRSAASRKERSTSSALPLDLLHAGAQRVDLRQVQFQQEAMMRRHPAVHRGDDLRAAGLQTPGRAIGQPLGVGLPGDQRRDEPPGCSRPGCR